MGTLGQMSCQDSMVQHQWKASQQQRVEGSRQKAERAEGRGQRAEGRGQRAEGRGQRAEGRGQRAEGRGQRAEGRGQRAEGIVTMYYVGTPQWQSACICGGAPGAGPAIASRPPRRARSSLVSKSAEGCRPAPWAAEGTDTGVMVHFSVLEMCSRNLGRLASIEHASTNARRAGAYDLVITALAQDANARRHSKPATHPPTNLVLLSTDRYRPHTTDLKHTCQRKGVGEVGRWTGA
jgi:hypothetical protein